VSGVEQFLRPSFVHREFCRMSRLRGEPETITARRKCRSVRARSRPNCLKPAIDGAHGGRFEFLHTVIGSRCSDRRPVVSTSSFNAVASVGPKCRTTARR